jgi:putative NADH-flavin reductase
VIGAAGRSGYALVDEAVQAGHKATAFVCGAAQYKKANVRVVDYESRAEPGHLIGNAHSVRDHLTRVGYYNIGLSEQAGCA